MTNNMEAYHEYSPLTTAIFS